MPYNRRSGALPRRFDEKMENTIAHHTQILASCSLKIKQSINQSINQQSKTYLFITNPKRHGGLVVKSRTLERKVGVRSSLRRPCCVHEQNKFTSQKYW